MKGANIMPGFNQTGPAGMGPMTGRGRGRCTTSRPAYGSGVSENAGLGRNMGLGRGFRGGFSSDMRGYRRRRPFYNQDAAVPVNRENDTAAVEALKAQLDTMQQSLEALNNRIAEMENK